MSRASLHEHWYNYQNHIARTEFRLDCSVAGGAAISDTGAQGAQSIEVMCAVFKSMETNAWVDLPLKEEVIPPHYKVLPVEE